MPTKSYVGEQGMISNEHGVETVVTFSLYPNSGKTAGGFCRVSDGSEFLHELFDSGNVVRLSSGKLDVPIVLTSGSTFRVIGCIPKQ